jgi:putative membrane protein
VPAELQRDWQRTSPTAVIIFIGRFVKNVLTHGLPALVPLAATFAAVESLRLYWLALALLPIAGIVLLWSFLSYLRFQFRVDDGLILLRQGVLQRERVTIEFERVQNVSIHEPFYMRPLGLSVLTIDTAGSQAKEIMLGGIRKELAQRLRAAILADARDVREEQRDEPEREPASRLLVERTPRQIARHGLTASGLFWVAIVFGFVAGLGGGEWFASFMKELVGFLIRLVQEGGTLYLVGIIAVLVAGVLMLPVLSVAGALIRHYDYRLTREGDTYRRSSGLINRQEEALRQHKIQSVVWKQNVIARALGLVTVKLEVARSGTEQVNASGLPVGVPSSFLVPALDPDEAVTLTAELLPGCEAASIDCSRPNARRFIGRKLLWVFTGPILAVSLPPAIFLHWVFLLLVPTGYGVAFLCLRRRWARWGYAVRGGYAFVRTGFLGFTTKIFPLFKMQRVDLRQSPGQRRARLAHVTLHLASGSMTIPHIRLDHAQRILDLTLYHVESTRRAWY